MQEKRVFELTIAEVVATQEYYASLCRKLAEIKKRPWRVFLTSRDVERVADVWEADKMREAFKEVVRGQSRRPQRERLAIHHVGHSAFMMTMQKLLRDEEVFDKRSGRSD